MLTLTAIRTQTQEIIERLAKRGIDRTADIQQILSLDESKRAKQTLLEQNLAKGNVLAKEIGDLFKSGNKAAADEKKAESIELKEAAKVLETELTELDNQLTQKLYEIPNAPAA